MEMTGLGILKKAKIINLGEALYHEVSDAT